VIKMRGVVLAVVILVVVVVVAGGVWLGVGYGLTHATGPVVSEERSVGAFTKVDVSGRGTVILTQGDTPSLRIEAQRSILDRLETSVTGDTLRIGQRSHWLGFDGPWGNDPTTYHLTVRDLRAVKLSGAVVVKGEGSFGAGAEEFVLECSGSSEVNLLVQAQSLRVDTSGSSDITLAGQADSAVFDSSGSTNVFARGLATRTASVECSGSSDIEVNASERLTVNASGSSTVSHIGNPLVSANISGSGEVVQLTE
jgi:hypothetical protein